MPTSQGCGKDEAYTHIVLDLRLARRKCGLL